jgi:hypothetical protein
MVSSFLACGLFVVIWRTVISSKCDCLLDDLDAARGEHVFVMMNSQRCLPVQTFGGSVACYPPDYGKRCRAWDKDLPSACASLDGRPLYSAPQWCQDLWCYVRKTDNCGPAYPSHYHEGLYYSYATCGSQNSWEAYKATGLDVGGLVGVLKGYVKSTIAVVTDTFYSDAGTCSVMQCDCPSCLTQSQGPWSGQSVFFSGSAYLQRSGAPRGPKEQCLAASLQGTYGQIVAKEDCEKKFGYMYFGSQGDGSITQWRHEMVPFAGHAFPAMVLFHSKRPQRCRACH